MAAESKADDKLKARHATALGQFKFIAEVETKQRKSELEALRFEAGDQWPEEAKISRAGLPANANGGNSLAVPARPMPTIRVLDQPLAQISSMAASADLGVKIIPKDGQANQDTAEVIAGLVRAIEADSHAKEVYAWGFQRMRSCGRGYWRVNKTYAKESGGFDQVVRIEPIKNGASVYLDPNASWQTSGGFWEPEFGFITEDLSADDYKRKYGESKLASDDTELTSQGDEAKNWTWLGVDTEGKSTTNRYYRIAEYFYATYETTKEVDPDDSELSREIRTRKVMWAKMNGVEFLDEPQEWDGHYIPIIQDTGNKFDVGGNVVYEGMVQPPMSACRMVNWLVANSMEKFGKATASPWMVIAGQLQGFEGWWNQANIRNFPYLEYNAKTAATGNEILPPPIRTNDHPDIEADMAAVGMFINFIRSMTGVPDAALGHVNANDKSGKAIEALKAASEQGSSNWLNYHANAIRHTGVVVVDLLPAVYDRPGRVERILGADGKAESVMLNSPFTRGEDGQPTQAPRPSMFGRLKSAIGMGQPQPQIEHHKLDEGQYSCIVDVGKSQMTQRTDSLTGLGMFMQAAPELVPRYADVLVKLLPLPAEMADELAARVKPPGVDDEQLPPQAQAKIQQMQAMIQELQQAADDNKTKIAVAAHSDATKLQVAGIQAETQITTAEIKAGLEEVKNQILLVAKMVGMEHEARLAEKSGQRETAHELHRAGHEVGQAVLEHEHAQTLAAMQHQQALEQGQQAGQQQQDLSAQGHAQALEQGAQSPPIDPNKQVETE